MALPSRQYATLALSILDRGRLANALIEIANSVEAVQDGPIHIELLNGPMLFEHKAKPEETAPAFCGDHIRGNLKRRRALFARQVERLQRPIVKSPRMSNIDQ
jgi:hypothetical protein